MRLKTAASLAFAFGMLATSMPASAFDFLSRPDRRDRAFDPAYADYLENRYGYRYEPRGYYPYYNSGYFGPPRITRFGGVRPPYYAAWGSNKRNYRHVEWHRRHYGGHRRGDW